MNRVAGIIVAGEWDEAKAIDRVTLNADDRQRRRIAMTGDGGTQFLLDFPAPVTLRDGDGLLLDDGRVIAVAGAPERLIEIAAPSPRAFVRLAWHLGNRHTDLQVAGERLRIRHDHVLEDMIKGLGGSVAHVDAPFDPEANVSAGGHGHSHGA